jgi:YVTN family beta-propeller protein
MNHVSNTLSMIATASNMVTTTIPVGSDSNGVAVSRDGINVANRFSNIVSVIATATGGIGTASPLPL